MSTVHSVQTILLVMAVWSLVAAYLGYRMGRIMRETPKPRTRALDAPRYVPTKAAPYIVRADETTKRPPNCF